MANDEYKEYLGKKVRILLDATIEEGELGGVFRRGTSVSQSIGLTAKLISETQESIKLEDIDNYPLRKVIDCKSEKKEERIGGRLFGITAVSEKMLNYTKGMVNKKYIIGVFED